MFFGHLYIFFGEMTIQTLGPFFNCIVFFFFNLFMIVLGLHCCTRAFSSCSKQRPPLAAVHGPLIAVASPAAEHGLQSVVVARGLQ